MMANMEVGKNNKFLFVNLCGCGAVAITAALLSCFYQAGLGWIKCTGIGTGEALAQPGCSHGPVCWWDEETSRSVTTHPCWCPKTPPMNHFIRNAFAIPGLTGMRILQHQISWKTRGFFTAGAQPWELNHRVEIILPELPRNDKNQENKTKPGRLCWAHISWLSSCTNERSS